MQSLEKVVGVYIIYGHEGLWLSWSIDSDFAVMEAPQKNLAFIGQVVTEKMKSVYIRQTGQGQEMTLINHIPSFTPPVLCIYYFSGLRLQYM